MPIFGEKTTNLSKLHYFMDQKSQQDAPFFRFFTKKLLLSCPYYVNKRPFSKKHTALLAIFCQKNFHALTNTVLSCHFFQIFHEKHPAVMPVFGEKKRQFCQNYTILWANKVNRMPFFPIFHENITALMPIFCQKIVKSLKNTLFSCLCFVKKCPLSQKTLFPCHFFQIFHEKSLPVMPIFGQKMSILSKLNYIMGPKDNKMSFFPIFHKE